MTDSEMPLFLDAQALIDAVPDATLIIDANGAVECSNEATQRLLGYEAREIAGNKINFLFSDAEGRPLHSTLAHALPVEVTAQPKSAAPFRVRLACKVIVGSEPRRFALSVRVADLLNELQPRAMQMTRMAVLGERAAALAHELNQPLSAIANYAQAIKWMLDNPNDTSEVLASLGEITAQAIRAGEILRRLRTLIQKGESVREPVAMAEVIDEIKAVLATEARLQGARIVVDLAPDLPTVEVDRIQIQQVLLSLIRNAVAALEHTPREQREIKLTTRPAEDGAIQISVADTGPGVDESIRPRLFATGLGLPVAKTIVEAHDGALVYKPNEPHGACFSFHLPAAKGR